MGQNIIVVEQLYLRPVERGGDTWVRTGGPGVVGPEIEMPTKYLRYNIKFMYHKSNLKENVGKQTELMICYEDL